MRYRIAKKHMSRNVLLNLWIKQAHINFRNLVERDRDTELGGICARLDRGLVSYDLTQLEKIQHEMRLRNYHFYHYLSGKIYS